VVPQFANFFENGTLSVRVRIDHRKYFFSQFPQTESSQVHAGKHARLASNSCNRGQQ